MHILEMILFPSDRFKPTRPYHFSALRKPSGSALVFSLSFLHMDDVGIKDMLIREHPVEYGPSYPP